jgi:hypothetical protein
MAHLTVGAIEKILNREYEAGKMVPVL